MWLRLVSITLIQDHLGQFGADLRDWNSSGAVGSPWWSTWKASPRAWVGKYLNPGGPGGPGGPAGPIAPDKPISPFEPAPIKTARYNESVVFNVHFVNEFFAHSNMCQMKSSLNKQVRLHVAYVLPVGPGGPGLPAGPGGPAEPGSPGDPAGPGGPTAPGTKESRGSQSYMWSSRSRPVSCSLKEKSTRKDTVKQTMS